MARRSGHVSTMVAAGLQWLATPATAPCPTKSVPVYAPRQRLIGDGTRYHRFTRFRVRDRVSPPLTLASCTSLHQFAHAASRQVLDLFLSHIVCSSTIFPFKGCWYSCKEEQPVIFWYFLNLVLGRQTSNLDTLLTSIHSTRSTSAPPAWQQHGE
jgi:hypothetical protein